MRQSGLAGSRCRPNSQNYLSCAAELERKGGGTRSGRAARPSAARSVLLLTGAFPFTPQSSRERPYPQRAHLPPCALIVCCARLALVRLVIVDQPVSDIAVRPGEQMHYLTLSTRPICQAPLPGQPNGC